MDNQIDDSLTFKIIRYGIAHPTFTIRDLCEELEIDKGDEDFIINNLLAVHFDNITSNSLIATVTYNNTTIRAMSRDNLKAQMVKLLPNALFSYVDHQEIVVAREATEEARKASERSNALALKSIQLSEDSLIQSRKATRLALIAVVVSVIIGLIPVLQNLF